MKINEKYRPVTRLAVTVGLLTFAFATAEAKQFHTTIQVGHVKSRSVRSELATRPSVTVTNRSIVAAYFDEDQNQLRIKGLHAGTATVTYKASVRVFNSGIPPRGQRSIPVEGMRNVEDEIVVTVVPVDPPKPPRPAGPPVVRRETSQKTAEAGRGFAIDLNSVGEYLRNVETASSDPSVARPTTGSHYVSVHVNGEGECVIVVRGEARNGGGPWTPFVRRVELTAVPHRTIKMDDPAEITNHVEPVTVALGLTTRIPYRMLFGNGSLNECAVVPVGRTLVSVDFGRGELVLRGEVKGRQEMKLRGRARTSDGSIATVWAYLPVTVH
jgi:hypothetical protein